MPSTSKRPEWEVGFLEGAFRATRCAGPGLPIAFVVGVVLVAGKMFPLHHIQVSWAAIILALSGFLMFSMAKVSLFRQGHWVTFGSSPMTARNRILYRLGYLLVILSVFATLQAALTAGFVQREDVNYVIGLLLFGFFASILGYVIWRVLVRGEYT